MADARAQTPPICPLPIRALLVAGDDLKGGDKNMLLHAAQALEAAEIVNLPRLTHENFLSAVQVAAKAAETEPPHMNILLSFAHTYWYGKSASRWKAKALFSPALWLNLNNDMGESNVDLRSYAVDLQISPAAFRVMPGGDERPDICYLDALAACPPKIGRDEAIRYFRENHELTLKGPVTLVATGYASTNINSINAALTGEGTVLTTTGPRTFGYSYNSSPPLAAKTPRLKRLEDALPAGNPLLETLYGEFAREYESIRTLREKSDFFHVYSMIGENPYPYMLAAAHRAIMTADSMSMPAEAIGAGIPLALTVERGRRAIAPSDYLVQEGYASWLNGAETVWPKAPDRPKPAEVLRRRVADLIWQNYGGLRQWRT